MNLPRTWSRMGFVNKAAWLCATHQARDYSDACKMLAALPRRKPSPRPDPVTALEARKLW